MKREPRNAQEPTRAVGVSISSGLQESENQHALAWTPRAHEKCVQLFKVCFSSQIRWRLKMIKQLFLVLMLSSLYIPKAVSGDLGDIANAATSFSSMNGNVAVGWNAENATVNAEAKAAGGNAEASAGQVVVDTKSQTGKTGNFAFGFNSGTISATADAKGGGSASAGQVVLKQR